MDPVGHLGQLLTGTEAELLADMYEDGGTLSQALDAVAPARSQDIRVALLAAGLTPSNPASVVVLRALHGASTRQTVISPVWTLPGYLAGYGQLTSSLRDLVLKARNAVTCSTYNFERSSGLWSALRDVAGRGTVDVRVYMDTSAADGGWSPTVSEVAENLVGAKVFRTKTVDGKSVRNHAKFIAVDHQFLIVTSANFSVSAEAHNIELGLRVDSPMLTEQVERQLLDAAEALYERVMTK